MIRSFRNRDLKKLWEKGEALPYRTLVAEAIFDILDAIEAAASPHDPAFIGFRFDEWNEADGSRYGLMISDHWLISYGWSDGHAIDVDLERLE